MPANDLEITPLQCPNCGSADINIEQELSQGMLLKCSYCSTTSLVTLDQAETPGDKPISAAKRPESGAKPSRLAPGEAEFGLSGRSPLWTALIVAVLLYGAGWFFEDTQYWLDERAIAIWAGALPLWLLVSAGTWRIGQQVWSIGLAIALAIFLAHIGISSIIDGRLNDDLVGIGAAYGGASLAGWLLGRGLHWGIRLQRRGTPKQDNI